MMMVRPFGRRGNEVPAVGRPRVSHPFGKRSLSGLETPNQTASKPHCCESSVRKIAADTEPHLQSGDDTVLSFDPMSGLYVLTITARTSSYTVTTANEEVLLDQFIAHCELSDGRQLWFSAHGHSANSDGHSLDDIERNLILEPLRQHRLNRARMAQVLGASVRTTRNKIRGFRDEVAAGGTAGIVPSCGSPP